MIAKAFTPEMGRRSFGIMKGTARSGEAGGGGGGWRGGRGACGEVLGDEAGQVGGEGHAAVGDGYVDAGGAGEAADDGLAVGGHGAGADLDVHDAGVVQAVDGLPGPAEEFFRPAVQFGLRGVQVDGGVRGFQVEQTAGVRAQGEVRGVYQPDQAGRGDRADPHRQPRGGGAGDAPWDERDRDQVRGPAAGAADYVVRLQDGAGGGADARRGARFQGGDPAGLAGEDLGAVALGLGDQTGDERFGEQVAL